MDSRLTSILLLVSLSALALAADKIPVTIYFESLCPDSKNFSTIFTNAYNTSDVKDIIKPDFVPYGINNGTACQHGPRECDGNVILGCAIHHINDTDLLVEYVDCIMQLDVKRNATEFPIDQCKDKAANVSAAIQDCWNGNATADGLKYNNEYKDRTLNFFKSINATIEVPWIVLNNKNEKELNSKLKNDFIGTLCSQLGENNKFKACEKSSGSTLVASLVPAVIALLLARL